MGEVELEMVEQLYQEFKDAHEPVARVKERLGNKKTKGQIAAKILEMGWCDDPAKLKVSKSSRKRRTGDELQKSSSESDSAMEDSSSDGGGSDGGSSEAPADNEPAGHGTKAEQLVQLIKKMLEPSRPDSDVLLSCLSWLSEAVGEEADDRCGSGDEDGAEDVPMVAVDAAVADALADSPELKQLMQLIQLSPPASHQEQYWRIPASVSGIPLRAKQSMLKKVLEHHKLKAAADSLEKESGVAENGGVDAEQIGKQSAATENGSAEQVEKQAVDPEVVPGEEKENGASGEELDIGQRDPGLMRLVVGPEEISAAAAMSKKSNKKKKEKRGANKWLPMRRVVDAEAQARINAEFPVRSQESKEAPKPKERKKKPAAKSGGKAHKKKPARKSFMDASDDGSSDDDTIDRVDDDEGECEEGKKKPGKKKPKKKPAFDDSSEDDELINKVVSDNVESGEENAEGTANRSKRFLNSSDEEGEEAKKDHKSAPLANYLALLDSSDEEGKADKNKKNAQRSLLDSSGDEEGQTDQKAKGAQ